MIEKPNISTEWLMDFFYFFFSIKFWLTLALEKMNHIHKFVVKKLNMTKN